MVIDLTSSSSKTNQFGNIHIIGCSTRILLPKMSRLSYIVIHLSTDIIISQNIDECKLLHKKQCRTLLTAVH